MDSVAAAYKASDPVELLVIAHNLKIDRCTDHQWQTKFMAGAYGVIASNQKPTAKDKKIQG
jgi:hypothetical protein